MRDVAFLLLMALLFGLLVLMVKSLMDDVFDVCPGCGNPFKARYCECDRRSS